MNLPYSAAEEWLSARTAGWSKFDRVSVIAGVVCGGAALAIAASLSDWELLLPYFLIGLVAACFAAFVAFLLRLAVFGRYPPDAYRLLPVQVFRGAIYWFAVKFGIVSASLYLIIAAGVSWVLRWPTGFLVGGFVLVALTMMIGDMIRSCALNVALIRRGWQSASERQSDI